MDSSSSWIDVNDAPTRNSMADEADSETTPQCCPMPRFTPNLQGPASATSISSMQEALRTMEAKAELHRVLQAIQCSADFGIYLCESFRDPRKHYIDDYWDDVCNEAIGIEEMHRLAGKANDTPLTDQARARFHQLARLFERLSRRIDRVVLS